MKSVEEKRAYAREYYANNQEKIKAYRDANRERIQANTREYHRQRRAGKPYTPNPRGDVIERMWGFINKTDTCWLWTGTVSHWGYGQFYANGTNHRAHRFVYEVLVGAIPDGLTIDHVRDRGCESTLCVNPEHLEPVTLGENSRRAHKWRIRPAHCHRGHEYTEENTRITMSKEGWRIRTCRTCARERQRKAG